MRPLYGGADDIQARAERAEQIARQANATTTEQSVEQALAELRGIFPDAKFITLSGDYTNTWSGEYRRSTRIQIATSWRTGQGGGFFNADTINECMTKIRQWQAEQAKES